MPLLDIKPLSRIVIVPFTHFFILFGYKLFSLFFPLYLLEKGFSLSEIGYAYLLIYGTAAVVSPLLRKVLSGKESRILIQIAFLGYIIYSIGMIFSGSVFEILVFQIILGIAAAIFYISSRFIISEDKQKVQEFSYFYATPFIANFLAPLIGGVIIVLFGFSPVFTLSIGVYLTGMVFAKKFIKGKYVFKTHSDELDTIKKVLKRWNKLFIAFSMAIVSIGVYRTFFVVFLEEVLILERNYIILWVISGSVILSILSLKFIDISRVKDYRILFFGNTISGIASIIIALFYSLFTGIIYLAFLAENIGRWLSETGKSSFLVRVMKRDREMAATLDTIITSGLVAIGSLTGGVISTFIGIPALFFLTGILLIFSSILIYKKQRINSV